MNKKCKHYIPGMKEKCLARKVIITNATLKSNLYISLLLNVKTE